MENINTEPRVKLSQTIDEMIIKMNINIKTQNYKNAVFYADKIFYMNLDLTEQLHDSLYDLCHCLYLNEEYWRCRSVLEKCNIFHHSYEFLILYGNTLFKLKEFDLVVKYLDNEQNYTFSMEGTDENFFKSQQHLLLGKAEEAKEKINSAIKHYYSSLRFDSSNIEVLDILNSHQLLSEHEKRDLLKELKFDENMLWLNDYYVSTLSDNLEISEKSEVICEVNEKDEAKINVIEQLYTNNNSDILTTEAEKLFKMNKFDELYIICNKYLI
jgi:uncharacterized protein YozE (UPF0346 family)